ncbi:aminotransferase class I/II-fold pyridoxal phosphate-dependent enzyme [Synechococcus sp. PCC 7336]|uniref:aminotransferase class I/II-fold pyridoxal phosphate-dependent enzyme n=1 Tax=Synechococcus sp. PCC 7336 TaxID=195250 RepID=UPI00034CAA22|nr:aminotransferase class I/II-fold pyridoxal phosphate-dependent enzyme [Synechococcus sp. PCC 7336]
MQSNSSDSLNSLALLKKQLNSQGVHSFEAIAEALYQQKQRQSQAGLYSQDRFTQTGSDCEAVVISPSTGESVNCILWCINHYLGLNRNPRVIDRAREAIAQFGTGCGTSALSGGMSALHKAVEARLAQLVGKERAILFPTGYTTNLGVLSALPGKHDFLLFDREAHASIIDGVKLSGRKFSSFRHNSIDDLERKLRRYREQYDNIIVIVESAYSMSGDLAPLKEIVSLKQTYDFHLYVDEAHTFGLYGKDGAGYCQELGITDSVDFIMSTLSKATASIGGFIACKAKYIPLLEWCANSFIFQASLTPGDAATILAALDELADRPSLRTQLHAKNAYMRQKLLSIGFNLGNSQSPIVPIFIPDPEKLLQFNKELFERGIFSVSIVYPAVKPAEGRLRFILNASHTYEQIDRTLDALAHLGKKYGLISPKTSSREWLSLAPSQIALAS